MGRSVKYVNELPARLEKVTVDQVNAVAQKYLKLHRSVTGVLTPKPRAAAKGENPDSKTTGKG